MMFFSVKGRTLIVFALALIIFFGAAGAVLAPETRPAFSAKSQESRRVYVLDAGHGGEDGGAVSADGVPESGVNLAVVKKLDALLRFLGEETALTRAEDVSVHSEGAETLRQKKSSDLKNRVAFVNAVPDAVLVSIHQNSLPGAPSVRGAQAFYNTVEPGGQLAHSVQSALNQSVNSGEKSEKQIDKTIYLMKNVTCPAVLVECGFLSNADEAARLQTPEHQKTLAAAIAAGILNERVEP